MSPEGSGPRPLADDRGRPAGALAPGDRPGPGLRLLVIAAFAAIVLVRMPDVVLKGRFWAEEGSHFFLAALTGRPLAVLFESYGGYLNLVANAAALGAHLLLPLPDAPYLTIATGLAFQLVPPAILLGARDAWLRPLPVRLAGVALILLVPGTEEIWLQSLHCQFELTLAAAIVLALEARPGWAGAPAIGVLALAPLCGPGPIVLLPFFAARAALERSPARLAQLGTLAAASAIQLAIFFHPYASRAYGIAPLTLAYVVTIRHLVEPFFGLKVAYRAGHAIRHALAAREVAVWALLLPPVVFGALAAAAWRVAAARWLLLAAGGTALAADYGAIGGVGILIGAQAGERYVFVPQALIGLAVLAVAAGAARHAVRVAAGIASAWLIVCGVGTYVATLHNARNGPAWRDQVRAWRRDPSHALLLWPTGWSVHLPPPRPH